jgi:tetratricopeptide (TPR) repeat protein
MASISLSDTSNQARQYIWPVAISGALERPILGWGQENFNYIFNKDYNPLMWKHEQWFDRAHNVFLDWFVASGFVGLITYLALYVLFLIAVWKSDLSIGQKSVLTGLIGGYAVHNIFVFDNLASYVFFFALLGFGGSLVARTHSHTHQSRLGRWMATKTFSTDAVEYIVAPISIVALVAAMYFLNVRPIQANTRLIAALTSCRGGSAVPDASLFTNALAVDSYLANQEIREQVLSCSNGIINSQLPGQMKQSFFELAMKAITDQQAATPNDARIYVLAGSFLSSIGQKAEAEKNLAKAHELTPRKQTVMIQLATIYLNTGEYDKSLALLKEAYESEPNYAEVRNAYLIALIASGNETRARALFTDPSLFETEMAARAYLATKQYARAIDIYKKLIAADTKNVDLRGQLAQVYYQADMIWQATETMRAIGVDFPEYKTQVEAAIKQIQAPKK